MYRFRNHRLIKLYSNGFQSLLMQTKYQRNVNCFALNSYTTQSDAIDISKMVVQSSVSKNLDNLRDKRLNILKRNSVSGEYDILTEAVIKCQTIEQLIDLITSHVNVMNNKHLSEVFESINGLLSLSKDYSEDSLKLLSSEQFNQLCNQTVKRIRFFQISEILTTMKALILLNVSPNTIIFQSLLQITRQMINDFSINQIIFLDLLLSKSMSERRQISEDFLETESLDDSKPYENKPQAVIPLVEALRLAVPLVLQLKIESKELDLDDTKLLVKCLRITTKHNLREDVINKLIVAVSHRIPELSLAQNYSVIASLITLPNTNTELNTTLVDRVINKCLNRVTELQASYPTTIHHNFVLSLILSPRTRRNFYNKGLYEMVANLVTQYPTKFNNIKMMSVLWALTRHSHVHYGLLDLFADKIITGEKDLVENPKTSFTNILQAFALPSNYKLSDSNAEIIYKTILESNHIQMSKEMKTKHLLFKILRHMSVLNHYPKRVIRDWITNYLESALSTSTLMSMRFEFLENLVILYQGLCLESNFDDCEDLKLTLKPLVEVLNTFQHREWKDTPKSNTLKFALTQGLGGNQFIGDNMFTDYGHCVDHVVVLRKGGIPAPIVPEDNKFTYISQLEVPSDSKIIGIIPLNHRDYCREPVIKKGETDFRLRTLQKCGIIAIPINLEVWEALAETEKVAFIMRQIQQNS